jgi:hypothetical protein
MVNHGQPNDVDPTIFTDFWGNINQPMLSLWVSTNSRDGSRNLAPSAARTHPNTGRLQKEPDKIGRCGDEFAMKQM